MLLRWYAVVVAGVVALCLAAPAAADSAPKRAKLQLERLGQTPAAVEAGEAFRVRVRVRNLPRRMTGTGRLTFSLRTVKRGGSTPFIHLRGVNVRRTSAGRARRLSRRVEVPESVRPRRYWFRACVRRGSGAHPGSCKWRRLRVTRAPETVAPPPGPPTPLPGGGPPPASTDGLHSLRAPVTGENFYFVMADRFENGSTANDHGGLPPGKGEGQSGLDPTGTGWYHGGDLDGLLDRIDYIEALGTTAIWLTPSFKNRAVQPEDNSAGYHGYWITDFTQIDPHLGTNEELRALVDAAHARGMKVYFDIITNHTADVIAYEEGARLGYTTKDEDPYREAGSLSPFDDRDFAGGGPFPALDREDSFPYTPTNRPGPLNVKVPSWLNDVTLYHNRGDTTFVGEDAFYGDFFGLDDLFTEHPTVVRGMIDIYKTWIRDLRIDGFRIDTMKHVNDEFWEQFAPEVLDYARAQGKTDFMMFGEVFDATKSFTSHYTTHAQVQAVIDFPFQAAAQGFAASSSATDALRDFFVGDDWYTDADSNVYQLPTFLGNHDMGRIGMFVRNANPGAGDAEIVARDRLAHELMYLSRGNPVVYYGDEQGFVGDGGDQGARQDMFTSQVGSYNDDDLIGTDATTAESNFDRSHPIYRAISQLADVTRAHGALRDGAQQHRYSTDGAGVYAFSRLDRTDPHEYVVALNNAETERTATFPTYGAPGPFMRVYGSGSRMLRSGADGRLSVTVPPLSAVVYRSAAPIPRSGDAPAIAISRPAAGGSGRDRMEVVADVAGDSFYEVTFEARVGGGDWQPIGTDDNAPHRVFHDVRDVPPGTAVEYRATVLDNAGHVRTSAARSATVAPPAIALEAPNDGGRVRGSVEVRALATPEHPHHSVQFERSVNGGPWTAFGDADDSSPVYTALDDTSGASDGDEIAYRAVLTYAPGQTVVSAPRAVTVVVTPVTEVVVHYDRPAGDYADWGLHFWGDATDDAIEPTWDAPRQRDGIDGYGAVYEVPITNDTAAFNFIVHTPSGDSVPATREPGGDRSFVPLEHPEIWLKQGDPTIYFTEPD